MSFSIRDFDVFHGMNVIDMGSAIGYKGIQNPMTNRITIQYESAPYKLYCVIANTTSLKGTFRPEKRSPVIMGSLLCNF